MSRCLIVILSLVMICGIAATSQASVLLYEGYSGYTAGSLIGQNPNGNTVGLNTTTPYAISGTSTGNITTGLTFGGLTTAGGALDYTTAGVARIFPMTAQASPYVGTLYESYLVNVNTRVTTPVTSTISLRLFGAAKAGDPNNAYFTLAADTPAGSSTTGGTTQSPSIQYDYNYGSGGPWTGYNPNHTWAGTGTSVLADGTTYMLLARYTNVGSTLSAGSPGVATMWALTPTQFDSFVAGGHNDAYLDVATVGTGASQVFDKSVQSVDGSTDGYALFNFDSGKALQLFAHTGQRATIDEVRFGSSVADVTPVPEPGTLVLLACGSLGLLVFAWRKRK